MASQVKSCIKTSEGGSLLQILGRTTTLLANLNTPEPQHGGFMVKLSRTGNIPARVHSYGYMGSVSVCAVIISPQLMIFTFAAGAGKSILWYNNLSKFIHPETNRCHNTVPQSSRIFAPCVN